MRDAPESGRLAGVKGADQIAPMPGWEMKRDEGHLGGYISNGAAPGTWCPDVWEWAVETLGVRSMLDLGCGLGHTARYFRELGCDVRGIDGSPSAVENSIIKDVVDRHDFAEAPFVTNRSFDLVWSAEFVEHVEERFSGNFLFTFLRARKYLMLTYAAPGQGGHHHVNEQPEEYWVDRITTMGFLLDPELTKEARRLVGEHPRIGMHFRARGLVFRREQDS